MAVLEVDVGNTRLKWRLSEDGVVAGAGSELRLGRDAHAVIDSLHGAVVEVVGLRVVEAIRVGSVAADDFSDELCSAFVGVGWPAPGFAVVTREVAGVQCAYRDVRRLGVDRWLAVLGAHGLYAQGAVVVDCGSAVTVDVLQTGRHLGGYIAPGLRLMVDSLFRDTDRVKVPQGFDGDVAPAEDTVEAVNRGVVLMVVGLIAEVVARAEVALPVLVTGGDGERLLDLLAERLSGVEVEYAPDLVLDGLAFCHLKQLVR